MLSQGQTWNIAQYLLHHMTYASAKFEVAMSNGLGGNAFTRNIWFDQRSRSHEALPSTPCDLWTLQSLKFLQPIFKVLHLQENTLFDLDPKVKGIKVTQNVAKYPRHHVTYEPAKFDVATSYG